MKEKTLLIFLGLIIICNFYFMHKINVKIGNINKIFADYEIYKPISDTRQIGEYKVREVKPLEQEDNCTISPELRKMSLEELKLYNLKLDTQTKEIKTKLLKREIVEQKGQL